jgi:hypothetical protein
MMAAAAREKLGAVGVKFDIDAGTILDGHHGWQLRFRDGRKDTVSFRWFALQNQLYQLVCTVPLTSTQSETAEATRVANSFHFLVH